MEYRTLGRSGLKVSAVSLGSWLTFGTALEAAASRQILDAALEHGINLLDTADVYNNGAAEVALGVMLKDLKRQHLVLASKCFFPMSEDVNDRGLSRKHIHESIDGSLQRLGTDYLDLYQCHRADPDTPLEETVMAMDDLVRQGKILYWGVSMWPADRIAEAVAFARSHGCHAPISNQPRYNLYQREIEMGVLATSARVGLGQIVYSPLAQGVLSGKYKPGENIPAGSRAADERVNKLIPRYMSEEHLHKAQAFTGLCQEAGLQPAQVALAFCLRQPNVSSVIIGASKPEQVAQNAAALELSLPEDFCAALDELFPAPVAPDQV